MALKTGQMGNGSTNGEHFVHVGSLSALQDAQCMTVQAEGHVLALFLHEGDVFAVDNRCPHMGFPLDKGTVKDGILTCHWHHARFDLASGGTFDQFADDVRSFPIDVRDDQIWVDIGSNVDMRAYHKDRLAVGLERDIPLVLGKASLTLLENGGDAVEPFVAGLEFGTTYRQGGWGQGLTMHVCMMNMLPHLAVEDRPRAMYHGLAAVARDSSGHPPRFRVRSLPGTDDGTDFATLKRWFRQFIEVRDSEGSERCIVSAIQAGANHKQMADMLFAAVTDHRYIDVGHPADFTNKALEALDIAGWDHAELVLTSLVSTYANAARMEESNAWRYPIDLITILDKTFDALPAILEEGGKNRDSSTWRGRNEVAIVLLEDDPQAIADVLLDSLRAGCTEIELAQTVAYAAALRIARFHTSNEFGDWDTALHTFTFANAIHQGLRRVTTLELLRGVFDAAMSVYLDRFLNIPAARLPMPNGTVVDTNEVLASLLPLLDRQQQVNQSASLVSQYFHAEGQGEQMLATLGKLLLREDRDFHTIQSIEAAFHQYQLLQQSGTPQDTQASIHVLIAAMRYLAAHSPTVRAQGQTYQIAWRLHQGEHLFEEEQ